MPISFRAVGTCRSFPATAVRRKSGGTSISSLPRSEPAVGPESYRRLLRIQGLPRPILGESASTETGYAMPLELWVQAAALGLRIVEVPVPLSISTRPARSAGRWTTDQRG